MKKVTIEKARELGFCFGVRRAIKIVENAARGHKHIATFGPIVHNRVVVDRLKELGVRVVNSLEQIDGETVAIPSHGVPPELLLELQSRGFEVIDTTCPTVRRAQRAAKKLADAGFKVIIFGDSGHPEVKGLLGWAGGDAIATMDAGNIALDSPGRKLGIVSQTTQSLSGFARFVAGLLTATGPYTQEVRIINTLCQKTQKRQDAALELARRSDLMIVVGGRNSSNTRQLADVCSLVVETHLVEMADELVPGWFADKRHIGVTAGASTPEEAIDEVMSKLRSLAGDG